MGALTKKKTNNTATAITPKTVELDLKVRLPENYLKAAQEMIDTKVWEYKDLNEALNYIFLDGLNMHVCGTATYDALGPARMLSFERKHGLHDMKPKEISAILEGAISQSTKTSRSVINRRKGR